jgi:hypothetical protein
VTEPRKRGFYWIRWTTRDEWEPARWTGRRWKFIGAEHASDTDPREIGVRIKPPSKKTRHCSICGTAEGKPHKFSHQPRYE